MGASKNIIVDGDAFFYIAYGRDKTLQPPEIVHEAMKMINTIVKELDVFGIMVGQTRIALSGFETFRRSLYPDYKIKRKPRPLILEESFKIARTIQNVVYDRRLEADDICIWRQKYKKDIIVAYDKDIILQALGLVYNWKNRDLMNLSYNPYEKNILMQALSGDSTDGIKGAPGIGRIGAEKIMNNDPDLTEVAAYFDTEDDFLKALRLVSLHQIDKRGDLQVYESVYDFGRT